MKELLTYLLSGILGKDDFDIEEETSENGFIRLKVLTDATNMGLIIGKNGRTINSIRNLLKTKATLIKIGFSLEVTQK